VKRRDFITLLGGAAAAWPLAALGQQQPAKFARIGFLRAAGPDDKDFTAFRSGLRALGYVEGQNIVIEQRYAAGSYGREAISPDLHYRWVTSWLRNAWSCSRTSSLTLLDWRS